jgi:GTP-binding protein
VADYPFTTLTPNLGIVKSGEYTSFVMADIPGLIEDAHKGKGLGSQFLRHVERCKVLLFLVDANDENPGESYKLLYNEIQKHDPALLDRKRILGITKMDSIHGVPSVKVFEPVEILPFSSVSREGLDDLVQRLAILVQEGGHAA